MPRITVKAAAELLQLPAYEQMRVLMEQKYPRNQPQVFRTPFYAPALNGIREFYRGGNDKLALSQARAKAATLNLKQRRDSNLRVLGQFEQGAQSSRALTPVAQPKFATQLGTVNLRLSLDLLAHEAGVARHLFYNFRSASIDAEIARCAIDIAHWVLEQAGVVVPIRQIEYVDFASSKVYRLTQRRFGTIKKLRANAKLIEAIWPTL